MRFKYSSEGPQRGFRGRRLRFDGSFHLEFLLVVNGPIGIQLSRKWIFRSDRLWRAREGVYYASKSDWSAIDQSESICKYRLE